MLFVTQTWEQVSNTHWSAKPTCRIRKMQTLQTICWPIIVYAHIAWGGKRKQTWESCMYSLHCINYIVFVILYSSHCIHNIVIIILFSLYCIHHIVFIHCIRYIIFITFHYIVFLKLYSFYSINYIVFIIL